MDIKDVNNNPYGMVTSQGDLITKSNKVARGKTDATSGEPYPQEDKVILSPKGKLYVEVYREGMHSIDIREEKVASIRAAIESGNDNINSKDIAQNMLGLESEIFG